MIHTHTHTHTPVDGCESVEEEEDPLQSLACTVQELRLTSQELREGEGEERFVCVCVCLNLIMI